MKKPVYVSEDYMAFGTTFCRECLGLKCTKGDQEVEMWVIRGSIFVVLFPLLLGVGWNIVGRGPESS